MEYRADIQKYAAEVDDAAVQAIVKYCGIALKTRDASLVSCTDSDEIDRIRKGFASKMLGLEGKAFDDAIAAVCDRMKADKNKHRVTFYYLLAETAGKLKALV